MAANMDLIARTLGQIIVNPEEWHQGDWRCGSGMCFAGHAAALQGYAFVDKPTGTYAEYVEDPEHGTRLYDAVARDMVEDGVQRTNILLDNIARLKEEGEVVSSYTYRYLAQAAELAAGQFGRGDRYKKVSIVADVAARELGLSGYEADRMFNGHNNLTDLLEYTEMLRDGESLSGE